MFVRALTLVDTFVSPFFLPQRMSLICGTIHADCGIATPLVVCSRKNPYAIISISSFAQNDKN